MNRRRKVAIIGCSGQLGTDLVEVLSQDESFEVMPLRHSDCDCTRSDEVKSVLRLLHPDSVINCAAYVRVDDCEDHVREAFEVNTLGALNVARTCSELDALCIYISTDYVFDGTKDSPYMESDVACPINVYGASKLAGEHLVRQAADRWMVVRMASLFGKTGARGKGGNFIETIIRKAKAGESLSVVDDVRMSPTYAHDAARALTQLIKIGAEGVVHLVNDGACSWFEFAKQTLALAGLHASIKPVSCSEYATRARRPKNSALRSEHSYVKLRSWQDSLAAYLLQKGHIRP